MSRLSSIPPVSARAGFILVTVIQLLFLLTAVLWRIIDGDEGFYILASKLVAGGDVLYRDFFYPQMPLLPYIYGAVDTIAGIGWYSGRILSLCFALCTGCLLYLYIQKRTRNAWMGVVAAALYSMTSLVFGWLTVVKTHSIVALLLFAAFYLLSGSAAGKKYFWSGLVLGCAVDVRLFIAALVPFFLYHIYRCAGKRRQLRLLALFTVGLLIGLVPSFIYIGLFPDQFVFNNITYHSLRGNGGLIGDFGQKVEVFKQMLAIGGTERLLGLQFLLLLIATAAYGVCHYVSKRRVPFALLLTVPLFVVCFLPTPTFVQYFSILIPFMVLQSVLLYGDFLRRIGRTSITVMVCMLLVVYGAVAAAELYRYTVTGIDVPGVDASRHAADWKISTVTRIAGAIDRENTAHGDVLTFWPGYVIATSQHIVRGMENHFGVEVGDSVEADERAIYRILSYDDVKILIAHRIPSFAVIGNWAPDARQYHTLLNEFGYRHLDTIGTALLYRRED
ncbi:MAG: hypothetical protein WC505_03845 [Patescibacteria group bacterium]